MTDKWEKEAKRIIRSNLERKGVKYKELSEKLKKIGVEETPGAINSKINRGSFSFVFFMQCMKVLEVQKINLEDLS